MSHWLSKQLAQPGSSQSVLLNLSCKELGVGANFDLTSVHRENLLSSSAGLTIPESTVCLIYNRLGSLAIFSSSRVVLGLAPPDSVVLVQPGRYQIVGSRGTQEAIYLANIEPAPLHLCDFLLRGSLPVIVRSGHLGLRWHIAQMEKMSAADSAPSYFETLAVSFGLIAHFESNGSRVDFAPLPAGLTDSLKSVCDQVAERPGDDWSTQHGAERAGYSQYHFSRMFKQAVGFGFHDFVERVRVGVAVNMLGHSPGSVLLVDTGFNGASNCSFNSANCLSP